MLAFLHCLLYESTNSYANATGTPSPDNRVGYGPTLGYEWGGLFLYGTYFYMSQDNLGAGGTFRGGTSYELELGYNWALNTYFYLGVSLIYENFAWNEYDLSGTSFSQTNTQTSLYPGVGLGFLKEPSTN